MPEKTIEELKAEVVKLKRELTAAYQNNHQRNLELDALHYVWCDGGCPGGTHRWAKNDLTAETVRFAVRNTQRLVSWWNNSICKEQYELQRRNVDDNAGAQIKRLLLDSHQAKRWATRWKKLAKSYKTELDRRDCIHPYRHAGPLVPVMFGSSPSEVCARCGSYRLTLHIPGPWKPGPPDLSKLEYY